MRAALLNAINAPLTIERVDLAPPSRGEILVRIGASGVCHSDTFILDGQAVYPLPVIPGHEGAGTVEEIGPGVEGIAAGDRAVLAFRPQCGRCEQCTRGRPVLCTGHTTPASGMFDGTARVTRHGTPVAVASRLGTFSEYVVAPAEQVIPIHEDVPMDVLALIGCGVTTGFCAVKNAARIEAGASVAIIGCGGVGLCSVMAASLVGARHIVAVDVRDAKLALARELGATATLNTLAIAKSADPAERSRIALEALRDMTGGGVDYAIEVTGIPDCIELAIESLRPRGTAIVVGLGFGQRRPTFDPLAAIFKERTIKGSWYGTARPRVDFPLIAGFYAAGRLPLDRLVSRRFSLDGINDAFEALHGGDVARCVVMFNGERSPEPVGTAAGAAR